ncbi:putative glycosyltransferase 5 [Hibiscus syriacus]|uniref:Putative glycosyltransferase 5 n=1 Tax=Hibiscus syriacus TaxID=106335 RepID=A0A6A3BZP2_HIBSY|nr:putative glycosyltransferase 5 [Hibiscus syriacus]
MDVVIPCHKFPLHIFEPRYRLMVIRDPDTDSIADFACEVEITEYRMAEVEWVQDIPPRDREDLQELTNNAAVHARSWLSTAKAATSFGDVQSMLSSNTASAAAAAAYPQPTTPSVAEETECRVAVSSTSPSATSKSQSFAASLPSSYFAAPLASAVWEASKSKLTTTKKLIEETNRIIADIRSDSDTDKPPENETDHNITFSLGPNVSNWDQQRQIWLSQNPGFPNFINGKARILLVTGSPPNPCDNAIGDHYLLKAIKNKIDYCRLHGMEIVYNMAHLDKQLRVLVEIAIDKEVNVVSPRRSDGEEIMGCFEHREFLVEEPSMVAGFAGFVGADGTEGSNGWKVFIENRYYLHGYWVGLVDRYEEMMEKHRPVLGDERWPFVTHFVGCKPCGSYGDYPVEKCLRSMQRAFNFGDNQVIESMGFDIKGC